MIQSNLTFAYIYPVMFEAHVITASKAEELLQIMWTYHVVNL